MGEAAEPILKAMGVRTFWVQKIEELEGSARAACSAAHRGGQAAALILSQRFLGAKEF